MNAGDFIEVHLHNGDVHQGVFIPSHDDTTLVIKLKSGYNLGLLQSSIKDINILQEFVEEKNSSFITSRKKECTISILHTGGTIASKVDYKTGGVSAKFSADELIGLFPELSSIATIKSTLISNMQSDDMRFAHYNIMAKAIEKEILDGTNGIILTQGTDTLHYTASALSFLLENLNIPVVIVGSQRSSDRGSSDASMNLICAASFIKKSKYPGVFVCMHDASDDSRCSIILGTRSRKMHTSRRNAFVSVNTEPFAYVSYPLGDITYTSSSDFTVNEEPICIHSFNEKLKIGMCYIHPQMYADELEKYSSYDGLILLGTGLGHCPITHSDIHTQEHAAIKDVISSLAHVMPVAVCSQTIFGRIDMNVYTPGRELLALGVLGNYCDMSIECAFIKLAYLLSNYEKDEVKLLFDKNLRGEISEKSSFEEKFI